MCVLYEAKLTKEELVCREEKQAQRLARGSDQKACAPPLRYCTYRQLSYRTVVMRAPTSRPHRRPSRTSGCAEIIRHGIALTASCSNLP